MLEKRFKNLKNLRGGSTPSDPPPTLQIRVCREFEIFGKWGGGAKKWFLKLIYTSVLFACEKRCSILIKR